MTSDYSSDFTHIQIDHSKLEIHDNHELHPIS